MQQPESPRGPDAPANTNPPGAPHEPPILLDGPFAPGDWLEPQWFDGIGVLAEPDVVRLAGVARANLEDGLAQSGRYQTLEEIKIAVSGLLADPDRYRYFVERAAFLELRANINADPSRHPAQADTDRLLADVRAVIKATRSARDAEGDSKS